MKALGYDIGPDYYYIVSASASGAKKAEAGLRWQESSVTSSLAVYTAAKLWGCRTSLRSEFTHCAMRCAVYTFLRSS